MQNTLAKLKAKKKNGGFTLIELMVVLAIIAVLAAVMVPQYMQYLNKSKKSADAATASSILSASKVAATDSSVTANFKATWDGAAQTITITDAHSGSDAAASSTELQAVAADMARSLGVSYTTGDTSFTVNAQTPGITTSGHHTYVVTYHTNESAHPELEGTVTETKTDAWWN